MPWRAYDPAAIQVELSRGRPVFVDFTADWCITCKVNESVVLDDTRVKRELERLGVATFKADWTLYDDGVRRSMGERLSLTGRVAEPSEIAAAMAYLASDEAASINGVALPMDSGTSAG